jgi:hypothetical protein
MRRTPQTVVAVSAALTTAAFLVWEPASSNDQGSTDERGRPGEAFVELHMPGERIRFVGNRRNALNKQLVSAYRNRKVDKNPKKWMTAGDFECIDENGKKIEGSLFHPLGKIKVGDEYYDIPFDEIKATLAKQIDVAKGRLNLKP